MEEGGVGMRGEEVRERMGRGSRAFVMWTGANTGARGGGGARVSTSA